MGGGDAAAHGGDDPGTGVGAGNQAANGKIGSRGMAVITAAMVLAGALAVAQTSGKRESGGLASSVDAVGGLIPRASGAPGDSVSTSTQEQTKMLSKMQGVAAAVAVEMLARHP